MRCFLGCFGGRSSRRHQKRRESDNDRANKLNVETAKHDKATKVEEIPKASVIPITEICEEAEEKCSRSPVPSPSRKRVTFDSKVKTYEHIALQESVEFLDEIKEEVKSEETCQSSSENCEVASVGLYPPNHRYNNCRESDDEVEEDDELDCVESDLDDDDEEYHSVEGFSEDKLLNSTKEVRSSNESVGDGNNNVHGVLNPVENLTQWKSAKSKERTVQKPSQKENSNLNLQNQELAVDASLATWLSTSETGSECNSVSKDTSTPKKLKYSTSHDDRPILGALTLDEINQFSATSTPRKSPSKSPDEMPIIGTVGGYWANHSKAIDCNSQSSFKGIPNTTSKYREDKSVNWHSTPFEARLEKALNHRDKTYLAT